MHGRTGDLQLEYRSKEARPRAGAGRRGIHSDGSAAERPGDGVGVGRVHHDVLKDEEDGPYKREEMVEQDWEDP